MTKATRHATCPSGSAPPFTICGYLFRACVVVLVIVRACVACVRDSTFWRSGNLPGHQDGRDGGAERVGTHPTERRARVRALESLCGLTRPAHAGDLSLGSFVGGSCRCRTVFGHLVQVAVLANHQNGRDSHVRQVKVFGPSRYSLLHHHRSLAHTAQWSVLKTMPTLPRRTRMTQAIDWGRCGGDTALRHL
jgi:hypothetical protein